MDCRDFLRLAEARCQGDLSRYACALFEWHRRTCPRCAAALARAAMPRERGPARERAAQHARVS
jgi:hypothetical protein